MTFNKFLIEYRDAFYDRGSMWMGDILRDYVEFDVTETFVRYRISELHQYKLMAVAVNDPVALGLYWSTGDLLMYMMEDWDRRKKSNIF